MSAGQVKIEFYDKVSGDYTDKVFGSFSAYTGWLDSNRGTRVMRVIHA